MNKNAEAFYPYYYELYDKVVKEDFVIDKSGVKTVELIAPRIVLTDFTDGHIIYDKKKTPSKYVLQEHLWYNSHELNINQVSNVEIWNKVCDTNKEINSNYGNLVYSRNNFSQFDHALKTLKNHKESRQGIIIYTRPSIHLEWNSLGASDFLCFTGDTIVKSPEGDIKISDLVSKLQNGERYPVYSVNFATEEREIKYATHGYKKGKKRILNIKLDNGEIIRTTEDHIFYVKKRNGKNTTYENEVKAKDLKSCDSLITLMLQNNGNGLAYKKSLRGGNNYKSRAIVHRDYFKFVNPNIDLSNLEIHHLDENPKNNSIHNLQYMSKSDHRKIHMSGKNNPTYKLSKKELELSRLKMANTIKNLKLSNNRDLSYYEKRNNISLEEIIDLAKDFLNNSNKKLSTRNFAKYLIEKNIKVSSVFTIINHACFNSFNKFKELVNENHKVVSIFFTEDLEETYDITVEDNHTFFVGKDGVLVHNCTNYQQFLIRNNKLTCVTSMRSCDAVFGIFNDLPWFTSVINTMYNKLKEVYSDLVLHEHIYIPNSFHVYERHFNLLTDIVIV